MFYRTILIQMLASLLFRIIIATDIVKSWLFFGQPGTLNQAFRFSLADGMASLKIQQVSHCQRSCSFATLRKLFRYHTLAMSSRGGDLVQPQLRVWGAPRKAQAVFIVWAIAEPAGAMRKMNHPAPHAFALKPEY